MSLGAHHPEALHAQCVTGVAQYIQNTGSVSQVLPEAQAAYLVHTRCSGHHDQRRELEISRELFSECPGGGQLRPSLYWTVEDSLRLVVLFRR